MIVKSFRGKKIPDYVNNKSQLIKYVLTEFRFDEPISNGEFVFELRCTRFGGVLHDLRKEGWDIITLPAKEKGHYLYYLVSMPKDKDSTKRKSERLSRKRLKALA